MPLNKIGAEFDLKIGDLSHHSRHGHKKEKIYHLLCKNQVLFVPYKPSINVSYHVSLEQRKHKLYP